MKPKRQRSAAIAPLTVQSTYGTYQILTAIGDFGGAGVRFR